MRGHPSPGFLPLDALGVSISVHKNEVVIGPRDNGFPGPAAALDGPAVAERITALRLMIIIRPPVTVVREDL